MSASTSRAWLDHYSEWTPHTLDYGNKTIVDYYRDNLRVNANKPATYFFGRTQTYAELDAQVRAAAAGLKAFGIRPGDKVAIGLDTREIDGEWRLRGRGWTSDGGELWEVLERLEADGCARYVVTDVTKDGTLRGPNTELLAEVARRTDKPVVASGGISSLEDLAALRELVPAGIEGAIVGKALYAGAFTLPEALGVTEELA